ncbi:o-succinylbenzoate synthase [Patescibacteria group bacterium]|nr:o-succinylbenzoate synthase [Patescibacteria group bacterium]MBU1200370.1 o-succinylbenzoate synthase [Patescibacteria group bacterium]MBU1256549.1 o-succinylbenzoate synthase [Patescibacteria group bacterium]MBU1457519.1 o-succinylbenzoate synthase [Patescibacteria group bacterium]
MKIKKVEILHITLPMKFTFTTGFGDISERDAVIVRLETNDGVVGYGEAAALSAPVYLTETTETCIHIIKDFLVPKLLNRELTIEEYVNDCSFVRGNNIAKHGVESALWEIESLLKKKSLKDLLGGTRSKVPIGESIGVQPSVDKLLEVVGKRVGEGYRRIKIKVKPGWDCKPLRAIRKKFPKISLMVDANSSYRLKDMDLLRKLDEFDLLMIEQPLAFDDIIDHAKVQKELKTPICLDESILSAEDARKAIEIGACRIINVKPGRVGGLTEVKKINKIAKKNGIKLWCGGMLETGIGKAYNVAVATLSEFSLPADITPSKTFFGEDVTKQDIEISNDGFVSVPSGVGMGYEVVKSRINKYMVKQFEIK